MSLNKSVSSADSVRNFFLVVQIRTEQPLLYSEFERTRLNHIGQYRLLFSLHSLCLYEWPATDNKGDHAYSLFTASTEEISEQLRTGRGHPIMQLARHAVWCAGPEESFGRSIIEHPRTIAASCSESEHGDSSCIYLSLSSLSIHARLVSCTTGLARFIG